MSLIRHYRIAFAVWLFVMIIGFPIAWQKGQPHYLVESVFQVSPTYMKNIDADNEVQLGSNSQYREYVSHLASSVLRYDIIERALQTLNKEGVDIKPAELTQREYIEKLQATLFVRTIPDTYMVRIGIESEQKENIDTLINAITESFMETTKKEQIYGSVDRLHVVEEVQSKLQTEIALAEANRVLLAEKLGVTTFSENTQNPYDAVLTQARDRLTQNAMELAEARAANRTFNEKKELPADARLSLRELRQNDLGMQTMRNEVFKRIEEINQTLTGLASDHPLYKDLKAEIKKITADLDAREQAYELLSFKNYQTRFASSLEQKILIEQSLKETVATLESQAGDYARLFQQAMRLTIQIRNYESELTTARNRASFLDTERNALGFVRLVTLARPAEKSAGMGQRRTFLILFLLASGLALGATVALDMMDRRIRTVNEAEQLMGMPCAGWQIHIDDLPTRLFGIEQSKRFAATLIRNHTGTSRGAFAFSSAKASTGVMQIILDAASALRHLGKTVLIIDADTASAAHAAVDLHPGLTDYLAGSASAAEIVQKNTALDVDVIPLGNQDHLGIRHIEQLNAGVEKWCAQYDFVLINLPCLLLSGDAELLIHTLGQVFLVVEADSVLRGEANRAKRLLQKIDPAAVGLFVNNVPMISGGGYMKALMIETLTHRSYQQFMTVPLWLLQWHLFWTELYLKQHPDRAKFIVRA
jgi:Mrp family chromosome partitioning ATPase